MDATGIRRVGTADPREKRSSTPMVLVNVHLVSCGIESRLVFLAWTWSGSLPLLDTGRNRAGGVVSLRVYLSLPADLAAAISAAPQTARNYNRGCQGTGIVRISNNQESMRISTIRTILSTRS